MSFRHSTLLFTPPVFIPLHCLDVDFVNEVIDPIKTTVIWVNIMECLNIYRHSDRTALVTRNLVGVTYVVETPEEIAQLIAEAVAKYYPDR